MLFSITLSNDEVEYADDREEEVCELCIQDRSFNWNSPTRQCAKFASSIDDHLPVQDAPICDSCCEEEFLDDAQGCFDTCTDRRAIPENIISSFERIFDVQDLEKVQARGTEVYMNKSKTFVIAADLSKMVEELRPLAIDQFFEDSLGDGLYVKDPLGTIHNYNLGHYIEISRRLKAIFSSSVYPELQCTYDGLLLIFWKYGELKIGAAIAPLKQGLIEPVSVVRQLRDKTNEAKEFFQITGYDMDSSEELRIKLESLNEDQLIDKIVVPLFRKLGYDNVVRVPFHGHGEAGVDIGPMRESNKLGYDEFCGIQTKAKKIHATAANSDANVNEVIRQLDEAFRTPRLYGNQEVKITKMFVVCSKEITPDAAVQLHQEIKKGRNIFVMGGNRLAEYMIKHKIDLPD